MKGIFLVSSTALALLCLCVVDLSCRQGYWKEIHDLHDKNLKNYLQQYSDVTSLLDCSRLCLSQVSCVTYSWRNESTVCRVYGQYAWSGLTWIGYRTYWKIYENCSSSYTLLEAAMVCIKLYNSPQPWTVAEQTCKQDGGHLYIMDTQVRQDALKAFIQFHGNLSSPYYIGSKKHGFTYAWVNGVPVDRFWHDGASQSADYVFCREDLGHLRLTDTIGTSAEQFVCELPILNQ